MLKWFSRLRNDNVALRKEVVELTKERDRLSRELHGAPGYTSIEGFLVDARTLVQEARSDPNPLQKIRTALECVIAYLDKGGEKR